MYRDHMKNKYWVTSLAWFVFIVLYSRYGFLHNILRLNGHWVFWSISNLHSDKIFNAVSIGSANCWSQQTLIILLTVILNLNESFPF